MKRENQVFRCNLQDKELYLIEDALICYRKTLCGIPREKIFPSSWLIPNVGVIDKLIDKLYKFWEVK